MDKNNQKIEKEYPVFWNEKDECCGCTACYAICPQNAILMSVDEEGFYYPKLNKEKCIKCYKCLRVCDFKQAIRYNLV